MDKNPKYIGRIVFFKYISITILIILSMISMSMYLSTELEHYFYKHFNPFIKNSISFSIIIVLGLLITYLVAGKVGESIIVKKQSPFLITFLGFIKIWLGIGLSVIVIEVVLVLITKPDIIHEFLSDYFLFCLLLLLLSLFQFLLIGAIHGVITSWFISKEIENFE